MKNLASSIPTTRTRPPSASKSATTTSSRATIRAAISRYQEALEWKPRDAEATYKLGVVQEKTGDFNGALANYQAYVKILPSRPISLPRPSKVSIA